MYGSNLVVEFMQHGTPPPTPLECQTIPERVLRQFYRFPVYETVFYTGVNILGQTLTEWSKPKRFSVVVEL